LTSLIISSHLLQVLELIESHEWHPLIKELEGAIVQCAKDQNSCRLLQWSVEQSNLDSNLMISNAINGKAFDLATHPYGCRLLLKALEYIPEECTKPLLEELRQLSSELVCWCLIY